MGLGRAVPAVHTVQVDRFDLRQRVRRREHRLAWPGAAAVEFGREVLFELRAQDASGPVELVSNERVGSGTQPRRTAVGAIAS